MKSIYIRPTNIVFGQKANYFIQAGTAKSLRGLEDVGFLSVEILKRQTDGNTVEEYSVLELEGLDFKDGFRVLNGHVRDHGEFIPPLVNIYMNLSPSMKTFGTAVNPEFGNVEETGILITISDIYPEKKERHIDF